MDAPLQVEMTIIVPYEKVGPEFPLQETPQTSSEELRLLVRGKIVPKPGLTPLQSLGQQLHNGEQVHVLPQIPTSESGLECDVPWSVLVPQKNQ